MLPRQMVSSQANFRETSFFPETSRPDFSRREEEKFVPRLRVLRGTKRPCFNHDDLSMGFSPCPPIPLSPCPLR